MIIGNNSIAECTHALRHIIAASGQMTHLVRVRHAQIRIAFSGRWGVQVGERTMHRSRLRHWHSLRWHVCWPHRRRGAMLLGHRGRWQILEAAGSCRPKVHIRVALKLSVTA